MKKVILVSAVALMALASCKKDYVCTYDTILGEYEVEWLDLDKDGKEAAETACDLVDGKLTVK